MGNGKKFTSPFFQKEESECDPILSLVDEIIGSLMNGPDTASSNNSKDACDITLTNDVKTYIDTLSNNVLTYDVFWNNDVTSEGATTLVNNVTSDATLTNYFPTCDTKSSSESIGLSSSNCVSPSDCPNQTGTLPPSVLCQSYENSDECVKLVNPKKKCGRPRNPIPRHKRESHINAEHRRRGKIQDGFRILRQLVPRQDQIGSRFSKANILLNAVDYFKILQNDIQSIDTAMKALKIEKEALALDVKVYKVLIQDSTSPEQKSHVIMDDRYMEYVQERSRNNPTFKIFALVIRPLYNSFKMMVRCGSNDQFLGSIWEWASEFITSAKLRAAFVSTKDLIDQNENIHKDGVQAMETLEKLTSTTPTPTQCQSTSLSILSSACHRPDSKSNIDLFDIDKRSPIGDNYHEQPFQTQSLFESDLGEAASNTEDEFYCNAGQVNRYESPKKSVLPHCKDICTNTTKMFNSYQSLNESDQYSIGPIRCQKYFSHALPSQCPHPSSFKNIPVSMSNEDMFSRLAKESFKDNDNILYRTSSCQQSSSSTRLYGERRAPINKGPNCGERRTPINKGANYGIAKSLKLKPLSYSHHDGQGCLYNPLAGHGNPIQKSPLGIQSSLRDYFVYPQTASHLSSDRFSNFSQTSEVQCGQNENTTSPMQLDRQSKHDLPIQSSQFSSTPWSNQNNFMCQMLTGETQVTAQIGPLC